MSSWWSAHMHAFISSNFLDVFLISYSNESCSAWAVELLFQEARLPEKTIQRLDEFLAALIARCSELIRKKKRTSQRVCPGAVLLYSATLTIFWCAYSGKVMKKSTKKVLIGDEPQNGNGAIWPTKWVGVLWRYRRKRPFCARKHHLVRSTLAAMPNSCQQLWAYINKDPEATLIYTPVSGFFARYHKRISITNVKVRSYFLLLTYPEHLRYPYLFFWRAISDSRYSTVSKNGIEVTSIFDTAHHGKDVFYGWPASQHTFFF